MNLENHPGAVFETIDAVLRAGTEAHGERSALEIDGERFTYRELDDRVAAVAMRLATWGIGGRRLAYLSRNSAASALLILAAMRAGVTLVPVNWRLSTPEMRVLLTDADVEVVVFSDEYESAARDLGSVLQIPSVYIDDLVGEASALPSLRLVSETSTEIAALLYTSGTSGRPKGVMVTEKALLHLAAVSRGPWQLDPSSVHLVVSPLYHTSGLMNLFAGFMAGARNILVRDPKPDFILDVIERENVTNAMMVPALLKTVAAAAGAGSFSGPHLRTIVFGSDRSTVESIDAATRALGPILTQGYGLTEVAGAAFSSLPSEFRGRVDEERKLATVGRALPGVEARIEGAERPGDVGEILLAGPQMMSGYWRLPDETAKVLSPEGWFRTGDLGYLDDDGFLFIADRLKELVISGGENIYPAEIERVLVGYDNVTDAAAVGVPDERWGEVIHAFVALAPGAEATEDELIDYCRTQLAGYKRPRRIFIMDDLPRNSLGKIVKSALRETADA